MSTEESKRDSTLRAMASNGTHYTMSYDFYTKRWLSNSSFNPPQEIDRATVTHVVSYKHRPYERSSECVVHGVYVSKKEAEDEANRMRSGGAKYADHEEYDEISDVNVTEHKLKSSVDVAKTQSSGGKEKRELICEPDLMNTLGNIYMQVFADERYHSLSDDVKRHLAASLTGNMTLYETPIDHIEVDVTKSDALVCRYWRWMFNGAEEPSTYSSLDKLCLDYIVSSAREIIQEEGTQAVCASAPTEVSNLDDARKLIKALHRAAFHPN